MENNEKFELLEKISKEAEKIIKNSIQNRGEIGDWHTLQDIQGMSKREHEWIPELVKNMISSMKASNDIAYLTNQSDFLTSYQAKISQGEKEGLSMNLSLKSDDPKRHQKLVAFAYGGDTGNKDEDGKPIIVNAKTRWINEKEVQEAADELTAFFVKKLEKRFSGDK